MPRHYDREASRMRLAELRSERRRERERDYEDECSYDHERDYKDEREELCREFDAAAAYFQECNTESVLYLCTVTIPVDGVMCEFLSSISPDRTAALYIMRCDAILIRDTTPPTERANYDKLFWVGEPSPVATPRRTLDGDYRAYCAVDSIGTYVFPQSSDNTYTLGTATFKLYETSQGSDEHRRVADLPPYTAAHIY
jgi:hypothetical protein